jgi:quinoprotein glucose dehydrogenase
MRRLEGGFAWALLAVCSCAGPAPSPQAPAALGALEPCPIGPDPTEAALLIKRIKIDPKFRVELVAAEPQFVNAVAFWIDPHGRMYFAETHRIHKGGFDVRNLMHMLDDDLACRTVEDRIGTVRKHMPDKLAEIEAASERVRIVEDRDGDGVADHAGTFADGFNTLADGIAAGVLSRGRDVWFANVPNLWLLRDRDGDGRAEERTILHHGYGVHMAFYGHDLHGLTFGPDGKLYFTVGDRGVHVETGGRAVSFPDGGAVLRCNPDGSDLEIFAVGLRNPQELAFDAYGNLWTGDNNNDYGDRARLVYIVEGGDSGWRLGYQHMGFDSAWMKEDLWKTDAEAPFRLPPIAYIGHGPSGMTYDPGVGLPERYRNHFFLVDFPGGVRSFTVKPNGASFVIDDEHPFLWNLWPSDVMFGPDSALYVLDWVEGWVGAEKGRVFKITPTGPADPTVVQVRTLLREGMSHRKSDELIGLLSHRDMRVRQEAHFELAARGAASVGPLRKLAEQADAPRLARLHAIWALGMLKTALPALLGDADPEIRAQIARSLGDQRRTDAVGALAARLKDEHARVRFFAALALGKIGRREAIAPVLAMIRENDNRDVYLRHAGVMALAWIGDVDSIVAAAKDPSPSARMAAALALRRLRHPQVALLLDDVEPSIVLEAARAIHDEPIPEALPALARLIECKELPKHAVGRVVNANFRLGTPASLDALLGFAEDGSRSNAARADTLRALAAWEKPSGRDRVIGLWRPLPPRDGALLRQRAAGPLVRLIESAPPLVQLEAIRAAVAVGARESAPLLADRVLQRQRTPRLRLEALRALAAWKDERLARIVETALNDPAEEVYLEAILLMADTGSPEAAASLRKRAEDPDGSVPVRQAAFAALGRLKGAEADATVEAALDRYLAGQIPPPLRLDVLDAAGARAAGSPRLKQKLDAYRQDLTRQVLEEGRPMAPFLDALEGGNARAGEEVFRQKPTAQCMKCHMLGEEGGQVGPTLDDVGKRLSRHDILESIVQPNAKITEGYGQVLILMKDESAHEGRIVKENERELILMNSEGKTVTVPAAEIAARKSRPSAMPEGMERGLTRRELRDLVEFLVSRK